MSVKGAAVGERKDRTAFIARSHDDRTFDGQFQRVTLRRQAHTTVQNRVSRDWKIGGWRRQTGNTQRQQGENGLFKQQSEVKTTEASLCHSRTKGVLRSRGAAVTDGTHDRVSRALTLSGGERTRNPPGRRSREEKGAARITSRDATPLSKLSERRSRTP